MQSTSVYGTAVGRKAPTIFHLNQTIMGKNTAATKSRKFKRYFIILCIFPLVSGITLIVLIEMENVEKGPRLMRKWHLF